MQHFYWLNYFLLLQKPKKAKTAALESESPEEEEQSENQK